VAGGSAGGGRRLGRRWQAARQAARPAAVAAAAAAAAAAWRPAGGGPFRVIAQLLRFLNIEFNQHEMKFLKFEFRLGKRLAASRAKAM
jgi:hypothetical protein